MMATAFTYRCHSSPDGGVAFGIAPVVGAFTPYSGGAELSLWRGLAASNSVIGAHGRRCTD